MKCADKRLRLGPDDLVYVSRLVGKGLVEEHAS